MIDSIFDFCEPFVQPLTMDLTLQGSPHWFFYQEDLPSTMRVKPMWVNPDFVTRTLDVLDRDNLSVLLSEAFTLEGNVSWSQINFGATRVRLLNGVLKKGEDNFLLRDRGCLNTPKKTNLGKWK